MLESEQKPREADSVFESLPVDSARKTPGEAGAATREASRSLKLLAVHGRSGPISHRSSRSSAATTACASSTPSSRRGG
jgi:hypothetical protein